MIYSYIITGPIRYAEYALISVYHLIKYGKVKPESIYITTPTKNLTTSIFAFKMLEKLGVKFRHYEGMYNKLLILNEIFKDTQVDTICQIDCDCIWMGEGDLTEKIKNQIKHYDEDINLWDMFTKEAHTHLKNRYGLLNGPLKDTSMYADFIYNLYGFSLNDFKRWLESSKRWIWGGLMFFPREYLDIKCWKQALIHAQFSPCDHS